jgi:hypothetical protein
VYIWWSLSCCTSSVGVSQGTGNRLTCDKQETCDKVSLACPPIVCHGRIFLGGIFQISTRVRDMNVLVLMFGIFSTKRYPELMLGIVSLVLETDSFQTV